MELFISRFRFKQLLLQGIVVVVAAVAASFLNRGVLFAAGLGALLSVIASIAYLALAQGNGTDE